MTKFWVAIALLFSVPATAQTRKLPEKRETLESLQKTYVGKWFVINQTSGWYAVAAITAQDVYIEGQYTKVRNAKVLKLIAIANHNSEESQSFAPNALGETTSTGRSKELFLDLIFLDPQTNQKLIRRAWPKVLEHSHGERNLETDLRLTTAKEEHALKVPPLMQSLIGKVLYADQNSSAFGVSATLDNLVTDSESVRVGNRDFCCMRPLRIMAAQYVQGQDAIILKLAQPDGNPVLAFTPYVDDDRIPLLARVNGSFYSSVPSSLTPVDVRGLRRGLVSDGMSRDSVEMLLGYPEKENDYGRGNTQLVFRGGRVMVYLNGSDRVTGVQYLDF